MKNNRGSVVLFIALAVVVVAGAAGFFLYKNKSASPLKKVSLPAVKLPASLNPSCQLKDPDLCKYLNRLAGLAQTGNGFSGKSVTTDKSGKKTESVWEMEGNNKSHFVTYEDGKEVFNTVIIADTTYTKDPTDNKWWKYVTAKEKTGVNTNFFNPEDLKNKFENSLKDTEDKTAYKKLGKEKCGNLTCFKYEVSNPEFTQAKQYLYFDDREYLMRMERMEAGDLTTVTTFDYGKVAVQVPSPVKEGEPAFNTFFSTPTEGEREAVTPAVDTEQLQEEMRKILEQSGNVGQ